MKVLFTSDGKMLQEINGHCGGFIHSYVGIALVGCSKGVKPKGREASTLKYFYYVHVEGDHN